MNKLIRFNRLTIGAKITIMYGGIFTVALLIVSGFIMGNVTFIYRDSSRKELDQTAAKVAEFIESGGEITDENLKALNPNQYVEIGITKVNTGSVETSAARLPFPFSREDFHRDDAKPGQMVVIRATQYMFGEKFATYDGQTYQIRVFRNYQREQEILRLFAFIFFILNVTGVATAFLIGRAISRITLRPIIRISETAERISIEDLSRRIEVEGPDDEIKKLAITFNDMIDRLEASFQKQNQFVADASHELRTPISVIQGYANLMDRWGKREPEILQEAIDSIKAETQHMTMLIKKLLFMAKGEQNKVQIQKAPLDLHLVAEDVIKEMNIMEVSRGIALESGGEGMILGDYDLIKQMFWIFLENAIKYSGDAGCGILVKIAGNNSKVEVSIRDQGVGIHKDDLPFIFERFYRADKSRSKEVPGTGLGLSIAAWIMKQHDAAVEVVSELGQGTEVRIRFPAFENKA